MMLQAMKGKFGSFVLKIFAVLLIISFGAWGIGDMITGQGLPTDVADVGETKISAHEFQQSFQDRLGEMRRQFGQQFDSQQARQIGVADLTLDRLISLRLLQLHASELELSVGDDQVREVIKRQPGLSDGQGGINAQIFRDTLARANLTEERYVATLRGDIRRSHLTDIVAVGSVAPDHMVEQLYRYRNEKRTADVMVVARAPADKAPEPGDAALREFYSKNEAMFTAPELRVVTFLHLDPDVMAKEVSVSEDELRDEYEQILTSISIPERRRVRQIVTADEATARRAKQALAEGRAFTDVAKDLAGMDEETTQLGVITRNQVPPDIGEPAFAAKLDRPSEPVKSALGWHILLVEKIEPGKTPTFEETRERVNRDLARQRAADALYDVANEADDALAGGASLEEVADKINIAVVKTKPFDARGRAADGKPVEGLPKDEEFLRTAFETEENQVSDRIETRTQAHLIVRVDSVMAPALRPFNGVRDQAVNAWKITQQDEAAKKKAGEILEKLKGGSSFEAVAEEAGLKAIRSKPFTRFNRAAGSSIPAGLAAQLFGLQPGQAAMAASPQGYAVARLADVQPVAPTEDADGIEDLKERMVAAVANDVMTQYSTALRARYPVHIDRGAIDRLFNEGTLGNY